MSNLANQELSSSEPLRTENAQSGVGGGVAASGDTQAKKF